MTIWELVLLLYRILSHDHMSDCVMNICEIVSGLSKELHQGIVISEYLKYTDFGKMHAD